MGHDTRDYLATGWMAIEIFLMKQFSENIPTELLESAKIDLWSYSFSGRCLFPVSSRDLPVSPCHLSTFINTWNDFMQW